MKSEYFELAPNALSVVMEKCLTYCAPLVCFPGNVATNTQFVIFKDFKVFHQGARSVIERDLSNIYLHGNLRYDHFKVKQFLDLNSFGDLFPRDNFGDFFPTHSSVSSMSLESEPLQLSV